MATVALCRKSAGHSICDVTVTAVRLSVTLPPASNVVSRLCWSRYTWRLMAVWMMANVTDKPPKPSNIRRAASCFAREGWMLKGQAYSHFTIYWHVTSDKAVKLGILIYCPSTFFSDNGFFHIFVTIRNRISSTIAFGFVFLVHNRIWNKIYEIVLNTKKTKKTKKTGG